MRRTPGIPSAAVDDHFTPEAASTVIENLNERVRACLGTIGSSVTYIFRVAIVDDTARVYSCEVESNRDFVLESGDYVGQPGEGFARITTILTRGADRWLVSEGRVQAECPEWPFLPPFS